MSATEILAGVAVVVTAANTLWMMILRAKSNSVTHNMRDSNINGYGSRISAVEKTGHDNEEIMSHAELVRLAENLEHKLAIALKTLLFLLRQCQHDEAKQRADTIEDIYINGRNKK